MTPTGGGNDRTDVIALAADKTRIVALGDPHGDVLGLQLALEQEATSDVAFVSVGDNIGYADGRLSSLFCKLLEERAIPSVYGNHEEWSRDGKLFLSAGGPTARLTDAARKWCNDLPYRIRIQAAAEPNLRLHIVHTLPNWAYVDAESARRLADVEAADVTVCGHSHRPAIYVLEAGARDPKVFEFNAFNKRPMKVPLIPNRRYIVDAGSLSRPMAKNRPRLERGTYAVVDLAAQQLELRSIDKTARMREMFKVAPRGAGV